MTGRLEDGIVEYDCERVFNCNAEGTVPPNMFDHANDCVPRVMNVLLPEKFDVPCKFEKEIAPAPKLIVLAVETLKYGMVSTTCKTGLVTVMSEVFNDNEGTPLSPGSVETGLKGTATDVADVPAPVPPVDAVTVSVTADPENVRLENVAGDGP